MNAIQPIIRDYCDQSAELNQEALDSYIEHASSPEEEECTPAHDATLWRLLNHAFDCVFPRYLNVDTTVRVTRLSYTSFSGLATRHAFQFTALFSIILWLRRFDPLVAMMVGLWAVGTFVLIEWMQRHSLRDASLFFYDIASYLPGIALGCLLMLVSGLPWRSAFVAFISGCLIVFASVFPKPVLTSSGGPRALRLMVALTFALCIPVPDAETPAQFEASWAILGAAVYLLLLPVAFGLQHWFAAHPLAVLDDVRCYSQTAPLFGDNLWAAVRGIVSHLAAFTFALLCSFTYVQHLSGLHISAGDWRFQLMALGHLLKVLAVFGIVRFACGQLFGAGQLPSPAALIDSYYQTWRVLEAWLNEDSHFRYPTAFQFKRPWSHPGLRAAVVTWALSVFSALTISVAVSWIPLLPAAPAPAETIDPYANLPAESPSDRFSDDYVPWSQRGIPRSETLVPDEPDSEQVSLYGPLFPFEFDTQYCLGVVATIVLLPPIVLFLTFHAMWGPVINSYANYFEHFKATVKPPLLTVSWTATRKRWERIKRKPQSTKGN